ncbi:hypothetical protein QUW50_05160 [Barnesiella viscericola]|uniref:hypothetical protein n=1 Tax=Barnesiella viscericola TaxID=397865 RepID=UPI0025A4794E|nr:hypothetical protein [Barnesiella viscericola]MDM8268428.1 hypothetical protein [Barnesiella viscericola]
MSISRGLLEERSRSRPAALRCNPWSEENPKPNGDHSLARQSNRRPLLHTPNRQPLS